MRNFNVDLMQLLCFVFFLQMHFISYVNYHALLAIIGQSLWVTSMVHKYIHAEREIASL